MVQKLDREKDRHDSQLYQRWRRLLVYCLSRQITIGNTCCVVECLQLVAVGDYELFHELDHAVAHLCGNVQTALVVAEVVAYVLLILQHLDVGALGVKRRELVLPWVGHARPTTGGRG